MELFHYHPVTKEFLNQSTAREDPRETKLQGTPVYMIPRNATIISTIPIGLNEIAVFEDSDWIIKLDKRGQSYFDKVTGQEITIWDIDVDIPIDAIGSYEESDEGIQAATNIAVVEEGWAELDLATGIPQLKDALKKIFSRL